MRAFRAIDEPKTCERFIKGHVQVLTDFGIENITTNTQTWMQNPDVYVVIAERAHNDEMVGGIRFHAVNGRNPLPVEEAIGGIDPRVHKIVNEGASEGTGELCALWNSRSVAGQGVSLLLIWAGISIVNQIEMNSIFTICADYTMPMVKKVGFTVEDSLGKNGTFVYPNDDYLARVLRKMNAVTLESADEHHRWKMISLRIRPEQTRVEHGPKGPIRVTYQLRMSTNVIHLNSYELIEDSWVRYGA